MTRNRGMHKEDIKAAIRKRGTTLENLSKDGGFSPTAIYKALAVPCPRVNRLVADFLGTTVHALWPLWYDRQGQRIRSSIVRGKSSRKSTAGHCEKRLSQ